MNVSKYVNIHNKQIRASIAADMSGLLYQISYDKKGGKSKNKNKTNFRK